MTDTASKKETPKFSWDYDVPDIPFWKDLPFTSARNFLTCYSANEITAMSFPEPSPKDEKWQLLLHRLQEKEATVRSEHAPVPLHEADQDLWMKLVLGRYTMHRELKEHEPVEAALREMEEYGNYNNRMCAKNMLADVYADYGRYAEAEAMGRECLLWLRNMEVLGPQSPQALGCERRLMVALWKQKKYPEALAMQSELKQLVEDLPGTKFEKYLDDERVMLAELVEELDKWKNDREACSR